MGAHLAGNKYVGAAKTVGAKDNWFWVWGALALSLLLTSAGTVLISLGTRPDPTGQVAWPVIIFGVLSVLAGFTLTVTNQVRTKRQAKQDEKKRTRHLMRFNDHLSSVIGVFVELLQSDNDKDASDRFFSSAVREARNLVSLEGVRICVYELELKETYGRPSSEADEVQKEEQVKYSLVKKAFGGRADPPRGSFTQDTEHGQAVVKVALGTTAVPISDPTGGKMVVDRAADAVWSSTLLVPLMDEHGPKGLLMIDTREPVVFTPEDVTIGWTIATIISLGMGSLVRGGKETEIEVSDALAQLQREEANEK